jgi:hypothetical protein
MLIDVLPSFVPVGSTLAVSGGPAGSGFRSGILDLLGLGAGVDPATADFIGNRTAWGQDPGIGWPRAQAQVSVAVALATSSGATLNLMYQGAEEDTTTHLPSTWRTIVESGEIAVTDMDAIGDIVWQFDFEPTHPLNFMPRFLSVLAQVSAGDTFTAGALVIPVTTGLDQQKQRYVPNNFTVYVP